MALRVNNSPIPTLNRHDVNRAASDRAFIDEHTYFSWFRKSDMPPVRLDYRLRLDYPFFKERD